MVGVALRLIFLQLIVSIALGALYGATRFGVTAVRIRAEIHQHFSTPCGHCFIEVSGHCRFPKCDWRRCNGLIL